MSRRLLFAAGGTGGHLFPALAVAAGCRRIDPGVVVEFAGTRGRLEERVVPREGYRLNFLWISGFEISLSLKTFLLPFKIALSIAQAWRAIGRLRPHAVICAGAYVSYPIGIAARLRRTPLILMASDARPGMALTKLAPHASQIHVAFESAREYFRSVGARCDILLSGNPVRKELTEPKDRAEARRAFGLDPGRPVLLAFGGSLGARSINTALETLTPGLLAKGIQVIWQTGNSYAGGELKESGLYRSTFIDRMDLAYAAADLVLARAGATTLAELAVVGRPSILVPLPIVTVHQGANAEMVEKAGAGVMIRDGELGERLGPTLDRLFSEPETLERMAGRIREFGIPDADERIAKSVMDLAGI